MYKVFPCTNIYLNNANRELCGELVLVLNRFFASLFASSHRYCNEHLLCPPHVFWTGWGPWERCTAQCGGGIQARRRTCENGPDCPGCNVVSNSQFSLRQIAMAICHRCRYVCKACVYVRGMLYP